MFFTVIPELINFTTFLTLIFIFIKQKKLDKEKIKKAYFKLTLPKIINMFEKIDLKNSLLSKDNYVKHTFNYELLTYLETKTKKSLYKLFNMMRLEYNNINNKFGVVLGCFLNAILVNESTLVKEFELCNTHVNPVETMDERVKSNLMLDYYFM